MKTIYTILYEDKVSTWGEMYDALYKVDGKPLTFPDDDLCEDFRESTSSSLPQERFTVRVGSYNKGGCMDGWKKMVGAEKTRGFLPDLPYIPIGGL